MTVSGKTHAGSIAERAIALLAERGLSMRSKDIADALEASAASIAACLEPHVARGTLLMCKVTAPSGRQTNEYRISAAGSAPGKGPGWKAMSMTLGPKPGFVPRNPRALPEMETSYGEDTHNLPKVRPVAVPLAQPPAAAGPMLKLSYDDPNPGLRFGKEDIYRNTLLAMQGDAYFDVKDATQIYPVAKKLGIKITTRKKGGVVRVWRVA